MRALVLLILGVFAVCVSAEEVLVTPTDRDRLIRLQDGKQIRLPAGSELIRGDDGRLSVRRLSNSTGAPQNAATATPAAPVTPNAAPRWQFFAGLEGASRSVDRDYTIDTDETNVSSSAYYPIKHPGGGSFLADGGTHSFTQSETLTSFAVVGGIKDTENDNVYQLGYYPADDIDELLFSFSYGFQSLRPIPSVTPFAKAIVGVGFLDGLSGFEADSFTYGLGIGVNYSFNSHVDIYGGLDYLMRKFGSASAKGTAGGATITYGTEEREETETRFYLGARYLFW